MLSLIFCMHLSPPGKLTAGCKWLSSTCVPSQGLDAARVGLEW